MRHGIRGCYQASFFLGCLRVAFRMNTLREDLSGSLSLRSFIFETFMNGLLLRRQPSIFSWTSPSDLGVLHESGRALGGHSEELPAEGLSTLSWAIAKAAASNLETATTWDCLPCRLTNQPSWLKLRLDFTMP